MKNILLSVFAGFAGGILGVNFLSLPLTSGVNAQDFQPHIVSAGELRVLDQDGKIRISLTPSGITLLDSSYQRRVIVDVDPKPGIHILDEAGNARAELFLYPQGESHLYLHDSENRLRTAVDPSEVALMSEDGSEVILDLDRVQKNTLRLRTRDPLGPALFLLNGNDRLQAALGRLYLPSDETRDKAVPSILLYGNDGKLSWSAP